MNEEYLGSDNLTTNFYKYVCTYRKTRIYWYFFKLHVQIYVIVTPDNARAAGAYLVRFCVDEVVELSLCLSVSASECPLVMAPFRCPFMKGPLLSFSAILLLLPLFYIRHGLVVLCMTENCSTWIHVQACVKAVNHAWKPIQEIGHFFYE